MTTLISANKAKEAAKLAISNPNFLNLTVYDMFAPFTNEDETNRVSFSDYLATTMGLIRDDADFRDVLTADVIYTPPTGAWSTDNNTMYITYQNANANTLGQDLVKKKQSVLIKPELAKLDAAVNDYNDWAGILTTREFAVAYYFDGTNRAAFAFAGKTFLCKDIAQLLDTTRADFRIRQDVSRQPAGDSSVFKTQCAGCHSGMDALSGSMAYLDATEVEVNGNPVNRYIITPGKVAEKYFNGEDTFAAGYVTKSDAWLNLWNEGPNSTVGFKGKQSGNGIKSFGELYANSDAFESCMAKRVYSRTCLISLETLEKGDATVDELTQIFKKNNHNMKDLFAESGIRCMGK
jgi:hypothetical protein